MFDRAAWRRLDEFVAPDGPGVHRFRHALMRDAAYEGLSFRRRRELHARVGDAICERTADEDEASELLSMHYFFALRYADAWRFSRLAGDRAQARIRQRRRGRVPRACDRRSRRRSTRLAAERSDRRATWRSARSTSAWAATTPRRTLVPASPADAEGRPHRGGASGPAGVLAAGTCRELLAVYPARESGPEVHRGRRGRGGRRSFERACGACTRHIATSKGGTARRSSGGRRPPRPRSGSATGRDAHRRTCRCRSPTRTPATSRKPNGSPSSRSPCTRSSSSSSRRRRS